MPRLYAEFAEVEAYIGLEAANKIREKLHGIKLYIRQAPNPDSEIVKLLGLETAQTLGDYIGGDWLRVPSGKAEYAQIKSNKDRLQIEAFRDSGMTVDNIAREMGCSDRWIYAQLAKGRPPVDPNQLDMFVAAPPPS